jgi:hypothetical protein
MVVVVVVVVVTAAVVPTRYFGANTNAVATNTSNTASKALLFLIVDRDEGWWVSGISPSLNGLVHEFYS